MEIREFAERVLRSESIEVKLGAPERPLSDDSPGEPIVITAPGRPENLEIRPANDVKVPAVEGMGQTATRARILHALANHELQAAELFAWALLAFPTAPGEYRQGLLKVLLDEQRHCRMYIARMSAFDLSFGDCPVSGYFWNKTPHIRSPLEFVCAMSLTFENANLDHSTEYATLAREAGDEKTAALIDQVYRDEIEHVRFGRIWLERFKSPDQKMVDAYEANVTWPLRLARARGRHFHPEGRVAAGLDPEFIERLGASELDLEAVRDGRKEPE